MWEFYLDFFGFEVVFEYCFDFDVLFYLSVQLGECEIYLFEYFGDVSLGGVIWIEVLDVCVYFVMLLVKNYCNVWFGVQDQFWGWLDMVISDLNGNQLIFCMWLESQMF